MDAYERRTNLEKKNLADIVDNYGRGRELFRPPTYLKGLAFVFSSNEESSPCDLCKVTSRGFFNSFLHIGSRNNCLI